MSEVNFVEVVGDLNSQMGLNPPLDAGLGPDKLKDTLIEVGRMVVDTDNLKLATIEYIQGLGVTLPVPVVERARAEAPASGEGTFTAPEAKAPEAPAEAKAPEAPAEAKAPEAPEAEAKAPEAPEAEAKAPEAPEAEAKAPEAEAKATTEKPKKEKKARKPREKKDNTAAALKREKEYADIYVRVVQYKEAGMSTVEATNKVAEELGKKAITTRLRYYKVKAQFKDKSIDELKNFIATA